MRSEKHLDDICEEVMYGEEYRRNVPVRAGSKKGKDPVKHEQRPGKFDSKKDHRDKGFHRERSPPRRYAEYTRLNRPRSDILATIIEKKLDVQWPKPSHNNRKNRDAKGYCKFHKCRGHETDDCIQLKTEVEHLVREGKLKEHIYTDEPSRHDRTE